MFIHANNTVYRKEENYYPNVFLEKHCFIENIECFKSNSEEEHSEKECVNLFLQTLKKIELSFSLELLKYF